MRKSGLIGGIVAAIIVIIAAKGDKEGQTTD